MYRTIQSNFTVLALALTIGMSAGFTHADDHKKDIVTTAVKAGSFKTLVAAVKAADLVETLQGEGPFTVFAPTDEAFANLPEGTLEKLLKPENKGLLQAILTYHVVPGKVMASQVTKIDAAATANGQRVDVKVKGGKVMIDGATVVKADIKCTNGVIHVIDQVIMPSTSDIVATAIDAGAFETLVAAVKAAGLVETLQGKGPFTVFAPTDKAFGKLPKGTIKSLLKPENREKLTAILTYHVVPGRVFSPEVVKTSELKTVQGGAIAVTVGKSGAMVNSAKIVKTDIDATNGVIHVIDAVLLPPTGEKSAKADATRRLIELASARGVPIYNHGNAAACAAIYEVALHAVMATSSDELCCQSKERLQTVMKKAPHVDHAGRRAWMYRHALDAAHASLMR